jgi:heme exporter protein B
VVWKDLTTERRSKEGLNALVLFSLLLLFIFQFALGHDRDHFIAALPGVLWLGFILSGLIAVGRAFQVEQENDCWEALVLAPIEKSCFYVGKLVGTLLLMLLVETLVLALFAIFFNLDVVAVLPALSAVIVLGTTGLAAAGTLFAAMTAHLRARELLLPVLLLPVQLPVLLATVEATAEVLRGQPLGAVTSWLALMAAADVIYVSTGILTFEFVLEG